MKYVRTLDGILDYDEEAMEKVCGHALTNREILDRTNGFKIADTIEELVNKYVSIDRCNHKKVYTKYRFEQLSRKEMLDLMRVKGKRIFAYVWVSSNVKDVPTLKPVAEMNIEGKLELL